MGQEVNQPSSTACQQELILLWVSETRILDRRAGRKKGCLSLY